MKRVILLVSVVIVQLSCKHTTENQPPTVVSPYPPLSPITIPWTDQNSIVCFGTSITYGFGAGSRNPFCKTGPVGPSGPSMSGNNTKYIYYSTEQILRLTSDHEKKINLFYKAAGICSACEGDSSYPRFLQEYLKIKVYNQGYTAARIGTGLDVLQDSVLSKKPALVLLEFGANEFLQEIETHQVDSLLNLLVQRIISTGSKVVILSFIDPDMTNYAGSGWTSSDSIRALAYCTVMDSVAKRNALLKVDYPFKGVFGHTEMMSDGLHPNGIGYKKWAENVFYALIKTFENNNMLK